MAILECLWLPVFNQMLPAPVTLVKWIMYKLQ